MRAGNVLLMVSLALVQVPKAGADTSRLPKGTDCALSTEPDLKGVVFGISASEPQYVGVSLEGKLPGAPQSVFIADGYALKVFPGTYFEGAGHLIGSPDTLDLSYYKVVPGGHTVSSDSWLSQVKSYACVRAGALFPERQSALTMRVYYPNEVFKQDWFHGNHTTNVEVQIVYQGGKQLAIVDVDYEGPRHLRRYEWNLDTRVLTIVDRGSDPAHPPVITTFNPTSPDKNQSGYAYTGALATMLANVRRVFVGKPGKNDVGDKPYPPTLELEPLIWDLEHEIGN